MVHRWPLVLNAGEIMLRPLRRGDRRAFERLRSDGADWLRPWDATDPDHPGRLPVFGQVRRVAERTGREGTSLSLGIFEHGTLVGQVSAAPILYGSQRTAVLGYWVAQSAAGRGIAPRATAMLCDHLFAELGIHRVEVLIRPENRSSVRVAEKLGMHAEGARRGAVHVNGAWRDHLVFSLLATDMSTDETGRGVLRRYEDLLERSVSRDTPVA